MTLRTTLRFALLENGKNLHLAKLPEVNDIVFARAQIESQAAGLAPVSMPEWQLAELKRRFLAAAQTNTLESLKRRDWRYVPQIFWFEDDQVAQNAQIVDLFFAKATARASTTWIKSLIFAYFASFPIDSPTLAKIAKRLEAVITENTKPSLLAWHDRHQRLKLFDPQNAPRYLAGYLLNGDSLDEGLRELGLDDAISNSASNHFMATSYEAALFYTRHILSSGATEMERVLDRLIEWSLPVDFAAKRLRYPQLIGMLAETLLLPWASKQPAPHIKDVIKKFLLARIGDPRLYPGAWQSINPRATEIFRKWLAGDTLLQFFDLLSKTADEIWEYRKKFWMAYYNKGAIGDAWFALGRDAYAFGQQLKSRHPELSFGELHNAAANQSVLFMRLGNFVVAEWSHSGKCRFWEETDRRAPTLYEKSYSANQLRDICKFEQIHYSSANGTWQRQVATFLRHETQIYVPEYEWMV